MRPIRSDSSLPSLNGISTLSPLGLPPLARIELDQRLGRLPELDGIDHLLHRTDRESDSAEQLRPGKPFDQPHDRSLPTEGVDYRVREDGLCIDAAEGEEDVERVDAERFGVEGHQVEAHEEDLVSCAEDEERALREGNNIRYMLLHQCRRITHAVIVVVPQPPAELFRDSLVRL